MSRMRKSEVVVEVEFAQAKNDRGVMAPCVFLTCPEGASKTEPIWGQSPRSIKRGLAILSRQCQCRATWHDVAPELVSDERQKEYDQRKLENQQEEAALQPVVPRREIRVIPPKHLRQQQDSEAVLETCDWPE